MAAIVLAKFHFSWKPLSDSIHTSSSGLATQWAVGPGIWLRRLSTWFFVLYERTVRSTVNVRNVRWTPSLKEKHIDRKEFPEAKTPKNIVKISLVIFTGNAYKERWTRIRDNHQKALNLYKTKNGQAIKLKPPKYTQQLTFLTPYLNDEKEWCSNLSPVGVDSDNLTNLDNNTLTESSDTQSSLSTSSTTSSWIVGRKSRYAASQGPSTANVLHEYLSKKETALYRNQSDPIIEFFINMEKTVNTFPIQDQVIIKAQLFQMVNSVEMRLAFPSPPPVSNVTLPPGSNVSMISNVILPPPPTSNIMMSPSHTYN